MNKEKTPKARIPEIRYEFWICLFLILVTITVYWQVGSHEFVSFDDSLYVTENRHVQNGLTPASIIWAFHFRDKDRTYWHPLTWLSHMLDCQLYGLNPGMHHRTNLIFHIANSLLLFLTLNRMTRKLWPSAFVAALFALHPLNVDSVAWIAERKNLLGAFFWLLTMLTYAYYVSRPGLFRYLMTLFVFLLGLMAKPFLVTLPVVLLLMDYWPLARMGYSKFKPSRVIRLVLEKVPFFVGSVVSIWISSLSVQVFGTIASMESVPVKLRIANALVSYVKYIGKMIWPHNLSIYYPLPHRVPAWQIIGALIVLAGISVAVIRVLKEKPFLCVGWLWFLGTLAPVLGIVQVGLWPAMADRFAYVPLIGLFIMIAWGVPELVGKSLYRYKGIATAGGVVLSILMATSWMQTRHWQNNFTLYKHALAVTANNDLVHFNFGAVLSEAGYTAEAIRHYTEALKINPNFARAHNNLGAEMARKGRTAEAIQHYTAALRIDPDFAEAYCNLGNMLAGQGKTVEAIRQYREAVRLDPDFAEAYYNLGNEVAKQGKIAKAILHYTEALRIDPDFKQTHNNMGIAFIHQGKFMKAIEHFRSALRIDPNYADARNNLNRAMNVLSKIGEGASAGKVEPNQSVKH